jgi:general secretion pathway protein L
VRNQVLARREHQVDAMLCETTQRILGTCETNYDRALNLLRGQESPAAALPKVSAVEILAELTGRIPADVPVTFDRILVDPDRVQLQGTTDNSKQIDAITSALRSHRCFREVKEGKVERTRDGQKVSFRLDIQVQCPAEQRAEG